MNSVACEFPPPRRFAPIYDLSDTSIPGRRSCPASPTRRPPCSRTFTPASRVSSTSPARRETRALRRGPVARRRRRSGEARSRQAAREQEQAEGRRVRASQAEAEELLGRTAGRGASRPRERDPQWQAAAAAQRIDGIAITLPRLLSGFATTRIVEIHGRMLAAGRGATLADLTRGPLSVAHRRARYAFLNRSSNSRICAHMGCSGAARRPASQASQARSVSKRV